MDENDESTEVEIFGQTYNVRGGGEPDYLTELARLVDSRMRDVAAQVATVDPLKIAILAGIGAGAAAASMTWGVVYRKRGEAQLEEARRHAARVVEDARKSAESRVKEADLEAKEKLLTMRSDFDRQAQQRCDEMKKSE